jgi:hypothetical protein
VSYIYIDMLGHLIKEVSSNEAHVLKVKLVLWTFPSSQRAPRQLKIPARPSQAEARLTVSGQLIACSAHRRCANKSGWCSNNKII